MLTAPVQHGFAVQIAGNIRSRRLRWRAVRSWLARRMQSEAGTFDMCRECNRVVPDNWSIINNQVPCIAPSYDADIVVMLQNCCLQVDQPS